MLLGLWVHTSATFQRHESGKQHDKFIEIASSVVLERVRPLHLLCPYPDLLTMINYQFSSSDWEFVSYQLVGAGSNGTTKVCRH